MGKLNANVWVSSCVTHTGNIREQNEDAFLTLDTQQLWAVADGMGGHDDGNIASQSIVQYLMEYRATPLLGKNVRQVTQRLQSVNQLLCKKAAPVEDRIIGSTICVLLAHCRHCVFLWAGDSRIYRFRSGHLRQITRDHSEAGELMDSGATKEEVDRVPNSEAITRAVGANIHLNLELRMQNLEPGDLYLLCSDGLYKELSDSEIADTIATYSMGKCADKLLNVALRRRGRGNITIMFVKNRHAHIG
jgi:protein phosphatase